MAKTVTIDPNVAKLRARLGGYRSRAEDDPKVVATKAELAEATMFSTFERLIADASPLSEETIAKITNLINEKAAK